MGIISYELIEKPYGFFEFEKCRLFDPDTGVTIAEIIIPDNVKFGEAFLHFACKTMAARLMGISYDEYDDICEEYGIGDYELPEIFKEILNTEFAECDDQDDPFDDDFMDIDIDGLYDDDFDVGSDDGFNDEPGGWDVFFGDDDEYGDDMDDY